jgi:hypothetical protein
VKKAILYYTDNRLRPAVASVCQKRLRLAAGELPIICVAQAPVDFGDERIVTGPLPRDHGSLFRQLALAAQRATLLGAQIVFCAEHDVLYPEGYFDFTPAREDTFYYFGHKFYLDRDGFYFCGLSNLSTLCCFLPLLWGHLHQRLYRLFGLGKKKGGWECSEPGLSHEDKTGRIETRLVDLSQNKEPNRRGEYSFRDQQRLDCAPVVDIRHENNLSRVDVSRFEKLTTIPYWGDHARTLEVLSWV